MKFLRRLYDWIGSKSHTPYGIWWLAGFFFLESVFFVPVDPLLVVFCINKQRRALFYGFIATTASVIGGICGYAIGLLAWESVGTHLVNYLISPEAFNKAVALYTKYENMAILVGAFSPIPYKAVTLSAGFCQLPLMPFVVWSIVGRGARFMGIATAVYFWGPHIKKFLDKYFELLAVAFTIVMIMGFLILLR